ncbi:MAG: YnfA family protein [Chloroflexota bacterium]
MATLTEVVRATVLFAVAGLAEIGGGWLVWQWLRVGRPWPVGLVGALVLFAYGVIPTFQTSPHFSRVYAAYGGVFIVLSLLWGRLFDGFEPDRWDILGAGICILGVIVIYFGPRNP